VQPEIEPRPVEVASGVHTGQDYNGQIADLEAAGCERSIGRGCPRKVDRIELGKLLKAISPRDVVVVSRLDRLARSTSRA
jgi:DNA invertase Pin-like site-specific DNA recombinase